MRSAWVDFKVVKQVVSMEMALAAYGVRLHRVDAGYLRGRCPLPTHQSNKSSLSFGVSTDKNAWACHSDSCVAARSGRIGGNVLDFVAAMESCSIRDAALKLQEWFGIHQSLTSGHKQTLPFEPDASLPTSSANQTGAALDHATLNAPLKFTLQGVDFSHPYLAERGITEETARLFGVGFFPHTGCMGGRVVIPIHSELGHLIAYAGRALPPEEPRYKFPPRFRKSSALFNLHRAVAARNSGTAVIVEGFFDCLKVHQAGFRCVVALMGSALSHHQERLIEGRFQRVVLMLDGDRAGRSATAVIAGRLVHKLFVKVIDVPDEKQPDQLSPDEIRLLLMQPIFP